jgi:pyruvate,orthophosphate dikinase
LINAQGEDVVAGIRTPMKVGELKRLMPAVWDQLLAVRVILELHYGDMQDLEFTIERGKLYMLQCRTGKRSPTAAFKIAVDQATRNLLTTEETRRLVKLKHLPRHYAARATRPAISKDQAIGRITGLDIERLFFPVIDPQISREELKTRVLGSGINAVPGAACGHVVFHPADAEKAGAAGEPTILVRQETSPEDVGGMHAAVGILTATGGKTSHAAVVARSWGKCCIVGCGSMQVDEQANTCTLNGRTLQKGDVITLDGSAGQIYDGELELIRPVPPSEYDTLLGWCDERRRMKVRANADTPNDALKAIELGAEGIGLCRTEHMFFETAERRLAIQAMIVADDATARRRSLDKLQPFQTQDFLAIFRVMAGKPVTIRLLDPPLHEFLPRTEADFQSLSSETGISVATLRQRAGKLHESNPMLGHRGCRLCITFPEILEMQVSAIIEAAVEATRDGVSISPEIMVPLTIDARELSILTEQIRAVADAILDQAGVQLQYTIGTMIETPRAALLSDRLARVAEFFSFGTNDLTQTTMALSRDDAGRFLPEYCDANEAAIFAEDPFQSLDQDGVGMLIEWGVARGRQARPRLKVGICGEHGGDPESVKFCHRLGFDYVSCSPYRVPVARLAAAQAVIDGRERRPSATRAKTGAAGRKTKPVSKGSVKRSTKGGGKSTVKKKKAAGRTKKSPRSVGRTKKAKSKLRSRTVSKRKKR